MISLRIRVGAICRQGDSLLLVEHEKDGRSYWLLPGGGVEPGETAEESVVREVLEETSLRIKSGRLVCVCESIFPDHTRHVVHFLFETTLDSSRKEKTSASASHDSRVRGHEFAPISALEKLTLYPPIQSWLVKCLSEGFPEIPEYLGALWE